MGLLSNSFVNSISNKELTTVSQAQGIASKLLPNTTSEISGAIGGVVSKLESGASSLLGSVTGTASSGVSSVTGTIGGYLSSAVKSVDGTFSSGASSLASGIDSLFSSSFQNTVKTGSATVQTGMSDPVATLQKSLDSKTGMYKLTSTSTQAQRVSNLGSAVNADGTPNLTGTSLSTVLNRYNFSSASSILPTLMSNAKTSAVGGIYTNLMSTTSSTVSSVTSTVSSVKSATSTAFSQVAALTSLSSYIPTDMQQLIGTVSAASTTGDSYVATDTEGNVTSTVATATSGTTASLVNQINSLGSSLGCTTSYNYTSVTGNNTAYNASLYLSATQGLQSIFQELADCERSASNGSQAVMSALFGQSSGSDLGMANVILSKITSPSTVNTTANTTSLVSNPNLTSSDVSTVNSIFSTIGASPTSTLSSSTATGSTNIFTSLFGVKAPVKMGAEAVSATSVDYIDLAKVRKTTDSFVSALLGTDVYAAVNRSTPMTIQSDGSLSV